MATWCLCLAVLLALSPASSVYAKRRDRRQSGSACTTSDGRSGSCVGIRSCPALDQLLRQAKRGQSSRAAFDKLRRETFRCPFTRSNPLVCCESLAGRPLLQPTTRRSFVAGGPPTNQRLTFVRQSTPRPQFIANPTRRTTRGPQFIANPTRRTTRRPQFIANPTRRTTPRPQFIAPAAGREVSSSAGSLPGEDQCGRRVFTSRIVGGEDADIGSWPWAASIGYRIAGQRGVSWRCGATLISARYLVTAGHCVSGLPGGTTPSMVRLGELDFNVEPDCLKTDPTVCADRQQDVPITSVIPHPQYRGRNNNAFDDDIGLVRMSRPVRFTEFVRPICLPLDLGRLMGRSDSNIGQNVYIIGWGRSDDSSSRDFTPVLQQAVIRVVPRADCERVYRRSLTAGLGNRLCASGADRGADTCRGDSGGPMMVPDRSGSKWYLTGVTSFGMRSCGQHEAVYTRVHDYIAWIRNNLR